MKVSSLLRKASECKTEAAARTLLATLERAFSKAKPLSHIGTYNPESFMEDGQPCVHFELTKVISNHYVTTVRPEIRDGKLIVDVVTNHMLDGLGIGSQSWEPVEGMEERIEASEDQTVLALAEQARKLAIANHAELIERVGVARSIALTAAAKSW